MKLNEFLKKLNEEDMPRFETTTYNEEDIEDALMSDKPEVELKSVFGEAFWPKIKRWLDVELKNVKLDDEEAGVVGGPLKAKLDKHLEYDKQEYEENVKSLTREMMGSYKKWSEKEIKDNNLPHEKIGQGG